MLRVIIDMLCCVNTTMGSVEAANVQALDPVEVAISAFIEMYVWADSDDAEMVFEVDMTWRAAWLALSPEQLIRYNARAVQVVDANNRLDEEIRQLADEEQKQRG